MLHVPVRATCDAVGSPGSLTTVSTRLIVTTVMFFMKVPRKCLDCCPHSPAMGLQAEKQP